MKLFKAIGLVLDSTVNVITTSLKAVENVAHVAETLTDTMLQETREEAAQELAALKAKRNNSTQPQETVNETGS